MALIKCLKYSLITFTALYFVSGIALICVISYFLLHRYALLYFFGSVQTLILSLYVLALLILLNTILGWHATTKRNVKRCYVNGILLKSFALSLTLIILLEVSASLWVFFVKVDLLSTATPIFQEKFLDVRREPSSTRWWDNIQVELECCGVHGPHDYVSSGAVPFTCCGAATGPAAGHCSVIYQTGCLKAFEKAVRRDLVYLTIITAGAAISQIPGVFLSWRLSNIAQSETRTRITLQPEQQPLGPKETYGREADKDGSEKANYKS